jgi:hypothetical protein
VDFATVGWRPYIYSRSFVHRWIVLHKGWVHWHLQLSCMVWYLQWLYMVKWKSSCNSISPSVMAVFHRPVGLKFTYDWLIGPHILLAHVNRSQCFGNWICFRPQVSDGRHILWSVRKG